MIITKTLYDKLMKSSLISEEVRSRSLNHAPSTEWVFAGADFSGQ